MKTIHPHRFRIVLITIVLFLATSVFSQQHQNQKSPESKSSKQQKHKTVAGFCPGAAISLKISTLGPGLELVKTLGERFSIRLGGNYFIYHYKTDYSQLNIRASAKFKVGAVSLLADYYLAPSVHLTTGIFYNISRESVTGKLIEDFNIGQLNVTPDDIGSLTLELEPCKIGPYLGLGFGRPISANKRVSFNLDIGVLYQGKPKVGLKADGMIAPTANSENEKQIAENLSNFIIYPLISVQLSFKIY